MTDLNIRLWRSVDILQTAAAIQSGLDKLEEWASKSLMKVKTDMLEHVLYKEKKRK